MYSQGKWFLFGAHEDGSAFAFAIKENFKAPSQVMKFLMGLSNITGDLLDDMCLFSSFDKTGQPVQNWYGHENFADLFGGYYYIQSFASGDYTHDNDIQKIFPRIYNMFMCLLPDERNYDYLREVSGGYIANSMLIQEVCDGFCRKFGGDASEFNLPSLTQKDVNMHPVKYIPLESDDAKRVRFMTRRVDQEDLKAKFYNYDDSADIVELIRERIKDEQMIILKSRQIQASIGMYVVFNLGVVWVPKEKEHYYVLMQIKCDDNMISSQNIWNLLRKYIVQKSYI